MTFAPVITTQADLEEAWRTLMGPDGFDLSTLWLMLIVDDRPLPAISQIGDLDDPPDEWHIEGLQGLLAEFCSDLPPDTRVAFLTSRPGTPTVTDLDRAWVRALYAAAHRAGVRCETVHLATRGDVRPLGPEELVQARRAAG